MHTGIDLGFGCTGIITLNNSGQVINEFFFGSKIDKKFKSLVKGHIADRLLEYHTTINESLNNITGTFVLEEPMGRLPGKGRDLIALKGIYLLSLINIVPSSKIFLPKATQIKKLFCGNGRAEKSDIIDKCRHFGYDPPNDHVADAYAMAMLSFKGLL